MIKLVVCVELGLTARFMSSQTKPAPASADESVPGLDAAALAQLPPPQAIAVLQEQNAQLRSALLTERQKVS